VGGEAEVVEEGGGGAEQDGTAHGVAAADLGDQAAAQQRLQRAFAVHAAQRVNLRAGKGLAVGDDGQHLERGPRQPADPRPPQQALDVARRVGRRDQAQRVAVPLHQQAGRRAHLELRRRCRRLGQRHL
jgi:hypothetical protein